MYSDKNIKKIKDNLDKISSEAEEIFIRNHYEPSLKEIDDIYKIILKFLKKKKKIIYGGYAQNSLILHKNKKDGFYKDTDLADIEFYSYEPVKDLIDLTDLIHELTIKNLSVKLIIRGSKWGIKILFRFSNHTMKPMFSTSIVYKLNKI